MSEAIRILHVDDEPDFAEVTVEFLTREDDRFEVVTATSAAEGLEALESNDVDCIVSDYDMPGRTGIEFLHHVRDHEPDLPFILFTGKGSEEVASEAISAGVTDYLQKKPGSDQYTVLANRIRNAVAARRSKREAERRQHRLEQTLKTVPACVVQIDYDGQFVFANERAEEVLGLEPDEVSERTYNDPEWDITDLDGNPIPDEELPFRQVRDAGEPIYGFRHTIEWPDGTRKALLVNGAPLFDEVGNVESTVFALTDITGRQERLQHLDAIRRNVSDVIWISSPDKGSMEFVTESYETVWGRTTESLLDEPLSFIEAIHEKDRPRVREAIAEQQDDPDAYEETYRVVHPDGEVRWVHDRSSGVYSDGDLTKIVGIASDITERKHHEEKREQVIDRVTDAIVEVDADWQFTLVNEQAEELYDMTEDLLLGRDFWEVFEAAKGTRFEDEYRRVMRTREPTSFVEHYDGLDAWFDIQAYPNDDGGLAFYFRDVSDRRQREEAYQRQLDRFEAFSKAFPDLAFIVSENGRFLEVISGEQSRDLLWTAPGEFIGQTAHEVFPQAIADDLVPIIQAAIESGESQQHEYSLELPRGERWFEALVEPLPFRLDGDEAAVWVARDITGYVVRERALERERNRFESIFETIPEPSVHVVFENDEPVIRRVNEAFEAAFGYSAEEAIGTSLDDLIVASDRQSDAAEINQDVQEAGVFQAEVVRQTAKGERPFLFTAKTMDLGSDEGERVEGIATYVDLTDQKRREDELVRQNERLDNFAAIVSHDLRNPINVAESRLELAKEECESEHLDEIDAALDRTTRIIDDVLWLAREGRDIGSTERVELADAVRKAWHFVGGESVADLVIAPGDDPGLPSFEADFDRLCQALENLFRNAIEHGGEGVTVTVGSLADGFYVADDGPGIPDEEVERVYEPGYSTSPEGTGFGLPIVEQIISAHGWDIRATSGSNGGARFEITHIDTVD